MSSPCVQSFPDPLTHDSHNLLRFVNPNSLSHQPSPIFNPDNSSPSYDYRMAYMNTDIKKEEEEEEEDNNNRHKFTFSGMLSDHSSQLYHNNCYLLSSSPSDDSDDYQHIHSDRSDGSVVSVSQADMFLNASSTVSLGQASFMNTVQMHASSSGQMTAPHMLSTLPAPGLISSMHSMSSGVDSDYLSRHSMHLNATYCDPGPQHYQAIHATDALFDPSSDPATRLKSSPATAMIQSFADLCTSRPVTPVSPLIPLSPGSTHGSKNESYAINELCFSSVFPMSESSCSRPFQPLPRPHTAPRPSSTATEKAEDKKKIPQSRGRRVSNIPSNGTRMFTCSFVDCGKVFKRSEHLKRHIRSIHTLEKPFECPYHNCNKRFSRSDNLNQHIRIHRHSTSQVMHVKDKSSTTSANTMGQSNSNVERGHTFSNFVPNYI